MRAGDAVGRLRAADLDPRRSLRIVGVYLAAVGAWVVVTGLAIDPIADALGVAPGALEIAKGLLVVVATAPILYVILRRWTGRLQAAARAELEAADRMRRAEEMRSSLLSGVSHELRTPLTAIVGYAATIGERGERLDPDRLGELAGRLVVNAERLRHLVDDLLEVDRLMHGMGRVDAVPADLTQLARRVVAATDPGDRDVEVLGSPVTAGIDVPKIERVVQHLLDNAISHTEDGTSIVVGVSSDQDHVRLVVEDDGDGLPEELIGQLFDPFVQDPGASDRASPGIGIGLTIVARFAALHEGSALAENRPDGGARFTVRLPRNPRSGAATTASPSHS